MANALVPTTATIKLLVPTNPKRGASAQRYDLYKSNKTVGKFLEAGGTRGDIAWDAARGYIAVEGLEIVDARPKAPAAPKSAKAPATKKPAAKAATKKAPAKKAAAKKATPKPVGKAAIAASKKPGAVKVTKGTDVVL